MTRRSSTLFVNIAEKARCFRAALIRFIQIQNCFHPSYYFLIVECGCVALMFVCRCVSAHTYLYVFVGICSCVHVLLIDVCFHVLCEYVLGYLTIFLCVFCPRF